MVSTSFRWVGQLVDKDRKIIGQCRGVKIELVLETGEGGRAWTVFLTETYVTEEFRELLQRAREQVERVVPMSGSDATALVVYLNADVRRWLRKVKGRGPALLVFGPNARRP